MLRRWSHCRRRLRRSDSFIDVHLRMRRRTNYIHRRLTSLLLHHHLLGRHRPSHLLLLQEHLFLVLLLIHVSLRICLHLFMVGLLRIALRSDLLLSEVTRSRHPLTIRWLIICLLKALLLLHHVMLPYLLLSVPLLLLEIDLSILLGNSILL